MLVGLSLYVYSIMVLPATHWNTTDLLYVDKHLGSVTSLGTVLKLEGGNIENTINNKRPFNLVYLVFFNRLNSYQLK